MLSEKILEAEILEILFENRNKGYGAYILRKYYNDRLIKALGIMLIFISMLCAYVLFHKHSITKARPDLTTVMGSIPKARPEISKPVVPKQPAKPMQKKVAYTQQPSSLIQIVKDNDARPKKLSMILVGNVIPNTTISEGLKLRPLEDPNYNSQPKGAGDRVTNVDHDLPLNYAEVMPAYPGGEEALRKFLQRNLSNPQDISDDEIVTVKIKFIVGYDGILKGFETIQDGGIAFNNEVIRVLKKMPRWIPGKASGENVSVYYTIPVKFLRAE
ncbi:MAG: hypothetical protein ABIO04_13395 [Ferruginibacter sp.]